jgi:enolase
MPKFKIKSIKAREILDSRGNPTIEVELETDFGKFWASVPSGASKGKYEAVELRDGGKRYNGKGVLKAIKNINKIIAPRLKGREVKKQREIDELLIKLDGTKNKSKLGVNAILAVSMAVCRAGANAKNLPLWKYINQLAENGSPNMPRPCFNVIEGGVHAGNELDFQEFLIIPGAKPFQNSLQIASEIYQELKNLIKEKYIDLAINLGDEGGFAPPVRVPEEALNLILEAAKNLNYQNKIKIVLDIAASQFYEEKEYKTKFGVFTSEDLLKYYLDLIKKYPIIGLEDPFAEDDLAGWRKLNLKIDSSICKKLLALTHESFCLIIGDDLLATNPKRIKMAKEKELCNAMIIKPNQIGTVTETIGAVKLAKGFGWKIIVSHRSGETNDDFISDFAVGAGADFIKAGAPARGERVAKYNRLLKIAEEI